MSEEKQEICDLLAKTLRTTRNLRDLDYLEYNDKKEVVYAYFKSGLCKVALVTGDDDVEMIQDILEQITQKKKRLHKPGKAKAL